MNGIDMWAVAAGLWIVLMVLALIAAGWLLAVFARIDRRARRSLEQLLAKGEIDIDDYRRRIALLGR